MLELITNLVGNMVILFFVINPHIIVPFFLSCTQNYTNSERNAMGRRMCWYGLFLGLLFGLLGTSVLHMLGVTIPAFRMGGGLLLAVAAWGLLYSKHSSNDSDEAQGMEESHADISLCPLAFPMFIGPATITTMISLIHKAHEVSIWAEGSVLLAMILIIILTYIFILLGSSIVRLLGRSGLLILEKIAGILLIAMSIEMIASGAKDYFMPSADAATIEVSDTLVK